MTKQELFKAAKPILFNGEMVRALLDGRKTVTRRVVKPQPELFFYFGEDGVLYGTDLKKWSDFKDNTELSERRLYGRDGREYLLADALCGLREEGLYGLVSAKRSQDEKRICFCNYLPLKQKVNEERTSVDLRGISRIADKDFIGSEAFRRKSGQQYPRKHSMGNARGELGGQAYPQNCNYRGEASNVKIERYSKTGNPAPTCTGIEPTHNSKKIWCNSICDLENLKPNRYIGQILYVRETWCHVTPIYEPPYYAYRADGKIRWIHSDIITWKPSIHMPKEAARIFLRVTGVRVERLREITSDGCFAEGVGETEFYDEAEHYAIGGSPLQGGSIERCAFLGLWNSTLEPADLPRYGWDANPLVWVYDFEKVAPK